MNRLMNGEGLNKYVVLETRSFDRKIDISIKYISKNLIPKVLLHSLVCRHSWKIPFLEDFRNSSSPIDKPTHRPKTMDRFRKKLALRIYFVRAFQQKSLICLPDRLGFFELSAPLVRNVKCSSSVKRDYAS